MNAGSNCRLKFGILLTVAALALGPTQVNAAGSAISPSPPSNAVSATPNPPGIAWCVDFRPGALPTKERLHGANLMRLRAAQNELAPGFVPDSATTGLQLLAGYQEELGKARPDALLAASYLAQVSTIPITAERYRRVNALLCVSTTPALAREIVTEAESQRERMAR